MSILAIDLGGTKTAIATMSAKNVLTNRVDYPSRSFESFYEILTDWKAKNQNLIITGVGIGLAGPIFDQFPNQRAEVTNVSWSLHAEAISQMFGSAPVYLCNDMESHGWGLLGLPSNDLHIINHGNNIPGTKALIAAGTGLGESVITWTGQKHIPIGGEGGHASFAPCSETEDQLLKHLRHKFGGHVSWERVLGGYDGFRNLTEFFVEQKSEGYKAFKMVPSTSSDWGGHIHSEAEHGCNFAQSILRFYAKLYGREAGNLALKCMPLGGIYVGGGIAPKILTYLQSEFMSGFLDKGRFKRHLEGIPVRVILDKDNGLKGAATGLFDRISKA